jgi:hypothetical protein
LDLTRQREQIVNRNEELACIEKSIDKRIPGLIGSGAAHSDLLTLIDEFEKGLLLIIPECQSSESMN